MIEITAHNLIQNRDMEFEQAKTAGRIRALERKMVRLHSTMFDLETRLGKASRSSPLSEAEINKIEADLTPVTDQWKELEAEKDFLTKYLSDVKECQREILAGVFAALDPFFVDAGLIGEVDEDPAAAYALAADETDGKETETQGLSPATPDAPRKAQRSASERSVNSNDRGPEQLGTSGNVSVHIDPKKVLNADYGISRAILRDAERDFECRHERLQQQRVHREQLKAAAGKEPEDDLLLELDLAELTKLAV